MADANSSAQSTPAVDGTDVDVAVGAEADQELELQQESLPAVVTDAVAAAEAKYLASIAEENASWLQLWTFGWTTKLVDHANKKGGLKANELPPLASIDEPKKLISLFETEWGKELAKPRPSLFKAMMRVHAGRLGWGGFWMLVSKLSTLSLPILLAVLLDMYQSNFSLWPALGISLLMGIACIGQSLGEHQSWYLDIRIGLQVYAALSVAIFRKALRLSPSARSKTSDGQISSLLSVDAAKVMDTYIIAYVHYGGWGAILQLVCGFIAVIYLLGWGGVVGCGITVIMTFISNRLTLMQQTATGQLATTRDSRSALVSDMLSGMKALKMYAWHWWFGSKVNVARDAEVGALRRLAWYNGVAGIVSQLTPVLVSTSGFVVFSYTSDQPLTAAVAFSSMMWFQILRIPLQLMPPAIALWLDVQVSFKRLQTFLLQEELELYVKRLPYDASKGAVAVQSDAATFSFGSVPTTDDATSSTPAAAPRPCLSDLSLTIPMGQFVVVSGPVGGGKSALLAALGGELARVGGTVSIAGTVASCPQTPWLMNSTVKDNIIFGLPFERRRFDKTVAACGLDDDLTRLPHAEETVTGDRGVALSGGQKQRIALARALYARANVYLLDDVLSAVDSNLAAHIFQRCLLGEMRKATRIVVVQRPQFAFGPGVDRVIWVDGGRIVHDGPPAQVLEALGNVAGFEGDDVPAPVRMRRESSAASSVDETEGEKEQTDAPKIAEDSMRSGGLRAADVLMYTKAYGTFTATLWCLATAGRIAIAMAATWWMADWVVSDRSQLGYNATGYVLLGVGEVLAAAVTMCAWVIGSTNASRSLHQRLLKAIVSAPAAFFDQNPSGFVLTRFIKDMSTADSRLPDTMPRVITGVLALGAAFGVMIANAPWLALVFTFTVVPYFLYTTIRYRTPNRDLQRIMGASRSPLMAWSMEQWTGANVIRGFERVQWSVDHLNKLTGDFLRGWTGFWATNQWLCHRCEGVGSVTVFVAAVVCTLLFNANSLNAGLIGLVLNCALSVPQRLMDTFRMFTETEGQMVSLERIGQYLDIGSEEDVSAGGKPNPTAATPVGHGAIDISDVSLTYREGAPPALNNVSFHIDSGKKVAVVGRSGAGKSTFIGVLLRLYPFQGHARVDGVDVASLSLAQLRKLVSVIPQDPFLFRDSLRNNLAGPDSIADAQLWQVLESVGLKSRISEADKGLEMLVESGGTNLSGGERQLICLARALLRPSSVFVLDEATANVDVQAEELLHKSLMAQESTVINVCHKLQNVKDFDMVLVMNNGQVAEYGPPAELVKNPDSHLLALLRSAHITLPGSA